MSAARGPSVRRLDHLWPREVWVSWLFITVSFCKLSPRSVVAIIPDAILIARNTLCQFESTVAIAVSDVNESL
jgi:hypothetical protein